MTPELIEPQAIERIASEATAAAHAFVADHKVTVVDLATLEEAVRVRAAIAVHQKAIAEQLAKPKSWAFNLHKWFCGLEAAALAPFNKLDAFEREQIRLFKAEQDRIRAERERALADRQRRAAEARAAEEAAALEQTGDHALAAAVVAEAIAAPAPVVVLPDVTRQVEALKFTRRWLWRVEHEALVPREFLCLDDQKIGAYVRSMKASGKIAGIAIYYVDDPTR